MAKNPGDEVAQIHTAVHIFNIAPTMLALCLTVVGLIKITAGVERITTWVDNFLAFNAVVFLASTVLAYLALRAKIEGKRYKLERVADATFLFALFITAFVAIFATFTLAG